MSRRQPNQTRGGYTLIEITVSVGVSGILMLGVASAISISTRATDKSNGPASATIDSHRQTIDLAADLQYATAISQRKPHAVTFQVPDRDGDGSAETIKYVWNRKPGGTLFRRYNGGPRSVVAENVHHFELSYHDKLLKLADVSKALNLLINPGFELGTLSWSNINSRGSKLASSAGGAYAGLRSLTVTKRKSSGDGAAQRVLVLPAGEFEYYIEARIKMNDSTGMVVAGLRIDSTDDGVRDFTVTKSAGTEWTKISGSIQPRWSGLLKSATFFIHTQGDTQDFHVDESKLAMSLRPALVRVGVELQTGTDPRSRVTSSISLLNAP